MNSPLYATMIQCRPVIYGLLTIVTNMCEISHFRRYTQRYSGNQKTVEKCPMTLYAINGTF